MQLNPYLSFNGQCEAAFELYAQVLGGKIVALSRFGDAPDGANMPAAARDQIMHVRLVVADQVLGDQMLMGSDNPPQYYEKTSGMSVSINVDDPVEGERIFKALAKGGTMRMPFEETFWAERFGMCVDRFGTPWMVNCAGTKA